MDTNLPFKVIKSQCFNSYLQVTIASGNVQVCYFCHGVDS